MGWFWLEFWGLLLLPWYKASMIFCKSCLIVCHFQLLVLCDSRICNENDDTFTNINRQIRKTKKTPNQYRQWWKTKTKLLGRPNPTNHNSDWRIESFLSQLCGRNILCVIIILFTWVHCWTYLYFASTSTQPFSSLWQKLWEMLWYSQLTSFAYGH